MIVVLKNGKEKEYYARCSKCGTEMNYRYSDVNIDCPRNGVGIESRYIICPVCGAYISVNLLTEEETKEGMKNTSGYFGTI